MAGIHQLPALHLTSCRVLILRVNAQSVEIHPGGTNAEPIFILVGRGEARTKGVQQGGAEHSLALALTLKVAHWILPKNTALDIRIVL